jgi:pantetheine hydrolase
VELLITCCRYRKINLFNEPKLTPGDEDQRVTFQSDSGVTFGTFTGFDILFENPSRTVLHNSNVTVVVFPTALNSSMPFFTCEYLLQSFVLFLYLPITALSIQHGYASANGVNLFAANYGEPKNAHGGSGIYSGDGTKMNVYIDGSPSSKLIVSNVAARSHRMEKTVCSTNVSSSSGVGSSKTKYALPGSLSTTNITNYVTKKDFDAWKYIFQSITLDKGDFSTTVCHNNLCCTFNITVEKNHVSSRDNFKYDRADELV